jgi:hypothetical protein
MHGISFEGFYAGTPFYIRPITKGLKILLNPYTSLDDRFFTFKDNYIRR